MNTIKTFENVELGASIRVMNRENGELWFVGKDVAEALGYADPQKALRMHVADEDKLTGQIVVSGQKRNAYFINESGLYSLILASKLPQAQQFKHWVTSEVLPQIRKTGGYIPVKPEDDDLDIMARALLIMQHTINQKDGQLADQADIIGALAPSAAYAEQVLMAPNCYTMTEVAKGVGLTVQGLINTLHAKGIIFRAPSGMLMLYAPFQRRGLEAYRTRPGKEMDEPTNDCYLVWTERGRELVHELVGAPLPLPSPKWEGVNTNC